DAWYGRGHALTHLHEYAEALESYERVIQLRPNDAAGYAHRSTALRHLGRLDEAIVDADRALELDPENVAALNNRGYALRSLGRFSEAVNAFSRAVDAAPDNVESRFNRAVCRLAAGDLAGGFAEYESRWRLRGFEKGVPLPGFPVWLGKEDIAG